MKAWRTNHRTKRKFPRYIGKDVIKAANDLAAKGWRFDRAERSGKAHTEYWSKGERKRTVMYDQNDIVIDVVDK